jgi:hypothetical protein
MGARNHVLRSDGTRIEVPDLTDLFELCEAGLVGRDDWLFVEGQAPERVGARSELKWAFIAAALKPAPYAEYEVIDPDDLEYEVEIEEADDQPACEVDAPDAGAPLLH